MVKKGNAPHQTYDKPKHQQSFGHNLALNREPDHRRYDLYDTDVLYAKQRDLAVAEDEARWLTDQPTQTFRPTRDTKKVTSRLTKSRQTKLGFKVSPNGPKHIRSPNEPPGKPLSKQTRKDAQRAAEQAAEQAKKDAEYPDVEKFLKQKKRIDEELEEEEKDFFSLPDVKFSHQQNSFIRDLGNTSNEVLSYSMQSGPDQQAAPGSDVAKRNLVCGNCNQTQFGLRSLQRHRHMCMPGVKPKKGRPPVPNEMKARPAKGQDRVGKPLQYSLHDFKVQRIRQTITRKFTVYDRDPLRKLISSSECAAELFEHARKQKKEASKQGYRDEDVYTDEEQVLRHQRWMMEDVEEAVEEWIRDPSHAVFQHESQDADNEQDDRSVTPTFAPSLLEVIHESEDISLEQRFGSVQTSYLAQPLTSHKGSIPPSACAFSACQKQSQDELADDGHSHPEWAQNIHFTEYPDAWQRGEIDGTGNFGQY